MGLLDIDPPCLPSLGTARRSSVQRSGTWVTRSWTRRVDPALFPGSASGSPHRNHRFTASQPT